MVDSNNDSRSLILQERALTKRTASLAARGREQALEMGVAPRAEIGTPDQAKEYLDMGVKHFSIGADMQILFDYWKNTEAGLREVLEGSS